MLGIMFQDITTLLLQPKAFKDAIDMFVERYKGKNITVVAGKENGERFSFFFFFLFFLQFFSRLGVQNLEASLSICSNVAMSITVSTG